MSLMTPPRPQPRPRPQGEAPASFSSRCCVARRERAFRHSGGAPHPAPLWVRRVEFAPSAPSAADPTRHVHRTQPTHVQVPCFCIWSPSILPKPKDWHENIVVCGNVDRTGGLPSLPQVLLDLIRYAFRYAFRYSCSPRCRRICST